MPGTALDWALVMLATQRLTSLCFEEITRPAREWLMRHSGTRVGYLLRCPWCASLWCAALALALWRIPYGIVPLGILAVSAGGLNLDSLIRRS